jgi:Carboxypeptidase regulatory-like domain/TonB dependent receptor
MRKTGQWLAVTAWLMTLLMLGTPATLAQVSTAVLLGGVQDQSGAAIVGATITLTSTDTGISTSTTSGSDGTYVFPQVAVGRYSLEVTMAGFRRVEQTGIVLNVNQKARVDVQLEVGEVTRTINVDASAELINTVDGEVGQVVNQKNVVDLPLRGRQFLELAFLTPGAVNAPGDYRTGQQGIAPAVNGNRPEHNSYTLNGASNGEPYDGQFTIVPSVDSVEEFKIQSGSFNAEFGRAGAAIINVITKSGTNSFHGSVYEFLRNDALNARNAFNPLKSPVKQNQYGGTIGGPIFKNKTFFFFNYEEFKERRASTRSGLFPTAKQLRGDFSGEATVVRDPVTGEPFPGNIVPTGRIDPIATKFAAYFPATQPGLAGGINFINNEPSRVDNMTMGWKIDHHLSAKDTISGVFNWMDFENLAPDTIPGGPGAFANPFFNKLLNIAHTRTWSPTQVNELRLAYQRFNNPQTNPESEQFPKKDYPTELGITGLTDNPLIRNRFPGLGFGQGYAGITRSYEFTEILNGYQIQDNFSWVKPRHSMKFGFGYMQSRVLGRFLTNAPLSYSFSGRFSSHAIADFLLGHAQSTTTFLKGEVNYLYTSQYHFYAQDQWQVNPNFTLNYGLRWEIHTPWHGTRGENLSFNPKTGNPIVTQDSNVGNFPETTGITFERLAGDSVYPTNYCCMGPIMPRFGFAWNLPQLKSTVLRGGYAVSLSTEIGNIVNAPYSFPFWIRPGLTETVFPGIGF